MILLNLTVLEIYAKNNCLTPLLLFSNGGHVFRRIRNPHISSMQDTPKNIHAKFGSNWSSSVTIEEFRKIVNNDGRQMIAIAQWPSAR